MAHALPEKPTFGKGRRSEEQVFGWLQELSNKWTIIHSLSITRTYGVDSKKPRQEIDFLLVGPSGIFGLEVKGGKVRREGPKWICGDGDNPLTKFESPWSQIDGSMAGLRNYFETEFKGSSEIPWKDALLCSGVIMPSTWFRQDCLKKGGPGPDVALETLYDAENIRRGDSMADYLERLQAYWGAAYTGKRELTGAHRKALVDALQPHVESEIRVGELAEILNEQLDGYTENQALAIDGLKKTRGAVIEGGPGTGKTLLAIHEAERLSAEAGDGASVLVLGHNWNLVSYLQERLAGVPHVEVRGFHRLMEELIARDRAMLQELRHREGQVSKDEFYTEVMPGLAYSSLTAQPRKVDYLIVDEAQDLLSPEYALVLNELRRTEVEDGREPTCWRLFLDQNQDVFDLMSVDSLALFLEEPGAIRYPLQSNCRNTKQISAAASLLSGIPMEECARVEGRPVDYLWYAEPAQQGQLVADQIKSLIQGGLRPEEIALLSRYNSGNDKCEGLANLPKLRWPVVDLGKGEARREGAIVFSSVAGFKGLDADAVILMDNRLPKDERDARIEREKYYVGASRARAFLAVLLHRSLHERFSSLPLGVAGTRDA